jgi:predicted RNA-binding protein Jag
MFLTDHGKTTMTLPPMEKFSRKRVHELASCYQLKSQSKGKGRGRFP